MLENGPQLFQIQKRGNVEHTLRAVKAAVRHEDVAVKIKSQEIAEGLDSDDGAGDRIVPWNRRL
jgi:hypothetical protein